MKNSWKAYLIFSEKELKAVVVIGVFILLSCSLSYFFPSKKRVVHYFYFDPNTIDSISTIRLGLLPKHFNTLSKFRKKGGRFYQPTDLLKWYGVPSKQLNILLPYVHIKPFKTRKKEIHPSIRWLDINKAGPQNLLEIEGIELPLANRIIRYRDFIGGYQSSQQLHKVYGMTDDIFQKMSINMLPIKPFEGKMHWSTMNYKQLASLEVFEPRQVWEILRIRKEEGRVLGWEELITRFDLGREQAYQLKSKTDIR
jgi:DNA uptake protein ComE-like DNA-binding protein